MVAGSVARGGEICFTNLRLRLGVAFSFVIVDRIRLSEL